MVIVTRYVSLVTVSIRSLVTITISMVLIYENDPLDNEDARGRFYHVCQGKIMRTEIQLPQGGTLFECPTCGIELEPEDFWIARQKGSV